MFKYIDTSKNTAQDYTNYNLSINTSNYKVQLLEEIYKRQ